MDKIDHQTITMTPLHGGDRNRLLVSFPCDDNAATELETIQLLCEVMKRADSRGLNPKQRHAIALWFAAAYD